MAQTTTDNWKLLLPYSGAGTRREYRFIINGTVYEHSENSARGEISHSVSHALFDQFGIGNAQSAHLHLEINADNIPSGAKIQREIRLFNPTGVRNPDTQELVHASEWLPKGVFFPNKRREEDGFWQIEAYDAIRKTETPWIPLLTETFPMSARKAVRSFASQMGVDVDTRTWNVIPERGDEIVDYPASDPENHEGRPHTIRQVLCAIAAAYGGNFIITDKGELRLVPVLAFLEEGAASHSIGLRLVSNIDGKKLPPVSRITLTVDTDSACSEGQDGGHEVTASAVGITFDGARNAASSVLSALRGFQYQMFTAETAILDPAAELGDKIEVGGTDEETGVSSAPITSFLARIEDDGSGYPDISAPGETESPDEMPAAGPLSRVIERQILQTWSKIEKTSTSITMGIYRTLGNGGVDDDGNVVDESLAEFFLGINNIRLQLWGDGDENEGLVSKVEMLPGSIYYTLNHEGIDQNGDQQLAEFLVGINNIRLQLWGADENGNPNNYSNEFPNGITALFNMDPTQIIQEVNAQSWISRFKVGIDSISSTIRQEIYGEDGTQQNPAEGSPYQTLQSQITQTASEIRAEVSREIDDGDAATVGTARSLVQQLADSISFSVTHATESGQSYAALTLTVNGSDHGRGQLLMEGNVNVSGQLSAEALYALAGIVADLTVNRLTTDKRIIKYLAGDTTDDNFIRIHDEQIEFVAGIYAGGTQQATDPFGVPIYWESSPDTSDPDVIIGTDGYPYRAGVRIYTTTTQTPWPVTVYTYTEQVKSEFHFEPETSGDGQQTAYTPTLSLGAGNQQGTNQGYIRKGLDGLDITFLTNSQDYPQAFLRMDLAGWVHIATLALESLAATFTRSAAEQDPAKQEEYAGYIAAIKNALGVPELKRTAGLDFSSWKNGSFTETDEDDNTHSYTVTFDTDGRPVKITSEDSFETVITW